MPLKKLIAFICLFLMVSSCYKVQPTTLEVTVKDVSGALISNASVRVFGEPTATPSPSLEASYETETNSNGVALFNLNNIYQPGQSGVAILKVEVEKNEKTGMGTIELVQESSNKLDVVIE